MGSQSDKSKTLLKAKVLDASDPADRHTKYMQHRERVRNAKSMVDSAAPRKNAEEQKRFSYLELLEAINNGNGFSRTFTKSPEVLTHREQNNFASSPKKAQSIAFSGPTKKSSMLHEISKLQQFAVKSQQQAQKGWQQRAYPSEPSFKSQRIIPEMPTWQVRQLKSMCPLNKLQTKQSTPIQQQQQVLQQRIKQPQYQMQAEKLPQASRFPQWKQHPQQQQWQQQQQRASKPNWHERQFEYRRMQQQRKQQNDLQWRMQQPHTQQQRIEQQAQIPHQYQMAAVQVQRAQPQRRRPNHKNVTAPISNQRSVRSITSSRLKSLFPKKKSQSVHGYDIPEHVYQRYEYLSIPNNIPMLRKLLRPRIFFDLELKGLRPLGRIVIQLYTEACPEVVLQFVRACVEQRKTKIQFTRLFPPIWIEGKIELDDTKPLTMPNIEHDTSALDHGCSSGILSFPSRYVRGCKRRFLNFSISFKPLKVLNGKRIAFGKVKRGYWILEAIQDFSTRTGKPLKSIVIKQMGVLNPVKV